jgi:[amino group carrier protein]-L-2-aminoadipate/L-glutamate 6-kinase
MKIVVKIGGSLLKGGIPGPLMDDIGRLSRSHEVALVHGGGEMVTEIATRLGKEQRFIVSPEGMKSRFTDRDTAEVYTMVMCGLVGKRIVLALQERGVNAVSLSGLDGALLGGQRKKKLAILDERGRKVMIDGGYTGRVVSVNAPLMGLLMTAGYVPVVSPVALGEEHEPLNIDGDRAASSLAAGISADAVVFATDVEGLMLDGKLVEGLPASEVPATLPRIGFGMQKKAMAAAEAVKGGVREAVICSGTRAEPVAKALAHHGCTVIS